MDTPKAPNQKKPKVPQPLGKKERQQIERRLPGVDRMLSFFAAAGVRAELAKGGRLWINGHQTKPLPWILPAAEHLDWNNVIDELALEYTGDLFAHTLADNAHFGEGLRAFLRPREKGFAVMRDEIRLAMIHATHARVPHCDPIYANFLKIGPHWQALAKVVHESEDEIVAEWKREQESKAAAAAAATAAATFLPPPPATLHRLDAFPDDLDKDVVAACLKASRRIREERQVAYDRPVMLESDYGELTLLPITGADSRLRVPFRLEDDAGELSAALLLADRDPLPLLVADTVGEDDAVVAWVCALLGFADATCIELESVAPPPRRERRSPRRLGGPSGRGGTATATRAVPRRRAWPARLEPVGHWVRYRGSFVCGHRRRLTDRRSASREARERARRVGITLEANETWVQPHTRGIPEGVEMRFRWHVPDALANV